MSAAVEYHEEFPFNWKVTDVEQALIKRIVARFVAQNSTYYSDSIEHAMDLIACHNHGCKLDFQKLLNAPDFDFFHDMYGIAKHLDRNNGQLQDFFIPRCARRIK